MEYSLIKKELGVALYEASGENPLKPSVNFEGFVVHTSSRKNKPSKKSFEFKRKTSFMFSTIGKENTAAVREGAEKFFEIQVKRKK